LFSVRKVKYHFKFKKNIHLSSFLSRAMREAAERVKRSNDPQETYLHMLGLGKRSAMATSSSTSGTSQHQAPFEETQSRAYQSECATGWTTFAGELSKPKAYVCCLCGERRVNLKLIVEHKETAHPPFGKNVQHVEWDGRGRIPDELMPRAPTRDGVVPSTAMSLCAVLEAGPRTTTCSRCNWRGNSIDDLHKHIVRCAGEAGKQVLFFFPFWSGDPSLFLSS
jgi:hypothetical protein